MEEFEHHHLSMNKRNLEAGKRTADPTPGTATLPSFRLLWTKQQQQNNMVVIRDRDVIKLMANNLAGMD